MEQELNQIRRFNPLPLVGFCICLDSLNTAATANPTKRTTFVEISDDSRIRVEQKQIKGRQYETLIVNTGRGVFRIPDERVFGFDQSNSLFFYNNEDEMRYAHEFFLSPKMDWLFVTRKLFHRVNIGYLYHLKGKQSLPIRPEGRRFDEAALKFFAKRLHFSYPTIEAGTRVIYFEHWANGRLIFRFGACPRYDRRGPIYTVMGYYSLNSGRFGLISQSVN
jgi:hypothetical protein